MYRNCIFCSGSLGSNDSLESFPVGRRLAFDAAKGRLWAVCPRCARWNLAPLQERWEALDAGERLFRGARLRAQSENVGLAKLRDGTWLIRIGQAPGRELAAWRYGAQLQRRKHRALFYGTAVAAAGIGVVAAGVIFASVGVLSAWNMYLGYRRLVNHARAHRTVGWVEADLSGAPQRVRVRGEEAAGAWLSDPDDGQGIALNLPLSVEGPDPQRPWKTRKVPLIVRGPEAHGVMTRLMVHVNAKGADHSGVESALSMIQAAGSPEAYVRKMARQRLLLTGADPRIGSGAGLGWDEAMVPARGPVPNATVSLALEMALHEDTERRALQGELAGLEEMWRQAEEIAALADRLPDVAADAAPLGA
jgi:hypothetical protein